ncbi:MAG TPA: TetR family transcriptional regulator, partial [Thermomicrobiales bacterium]|nr:TetR family transcriptional regulator [Thermomicrobiales bacterium]
MDRTLLKTIADLAKTNPVPLAELSMDDLASRLGVTRMTLYRRAGTRQEILAALEEMGIDTRERPDVFERVVLATAALLRERPLADLTLETIAGEAGCSLPALYARFGGRQGVLRAVIERYSPLLPVRNVVASEVDESTSLRHDVRLLYGTVFEKMRGEALVMRSLVAELLRDPESEVAEAFREWYLPQLTSVLIPIFTRHMEGGSMRRLPIPIAVQTFIG